MGACYKQRQDIVSELLSMYNLPSYERFKALSSSSIVDERHGNIYNIQRKRQSILLISHAVTPSETVKAAVTLTLDLIGGKGAHL